MDFHRCRTDLPVLMLYNLDPAWSQEDVHQSLSTSRALSAALRQVGHPLQELCLDDDNLPARLAAYSPQEWLVFNWCEEIPGSLRSAHLPAAYLERAGFAFTGSPARTLELAQNKRRIKRLIERAGLPTPRWRAYTTTRVEGWKHFPAIVKPAYEHCSLGIDGHSVAQTPAELKTQVARVCENLRQPALVEEFIDGREWIVSVLGNNPARMLPPAVMDFSDLSDVRRRVRTYAAKFDPQSPDYDARRLRLNAALSVPERRTLESVALAASQAVGCRDYARLDFRQCDGVFYVIDVNPNPDISLDASLPRTAQADGLSYGQLGSILVNLAARRPRLFQQPESSQRERKTRSWQELPGLPAAANPK